MAVTPSVRCVVHSAAVFTAVALAPLVQSLGGADAVAIAATRGEIVAQPLAPRSGPPGATMFALLSPQETGIVTENNYADPKMWGERYQEFALGAIGTGVAIGDVDGDGRPDLFLVSKTGTSRLFRNLGGWKFTDVTTAAGLAKETGSWTDAVKSWIGLGSSVPAESIDAWKQGAAFADINNDGWLDLYVCRFAAPNLLFVNQRDGTFKEEAAARGLAIVDASGMAAFCDYDRDGWLDAYLQTNMLDAATHPNGQPDYLFRNNRDGTFTDTTAAAGIAGETLAHSATWWDYDHDGWPDLYVANDFAGPDRLYHNNRDGTFTNTINTMAPHTPYSSMGADLGDVNNDGRIDFLVADMATTTHEKDQRGMASSRALSRDDTDSTTVAPQILRNALLLNTGTSSFLEAAGLAGIAATDWTWSVRWEDLDNDGRLDLHVTNGMNREYQNADLRERIILAESLARRMELMRSSPVLAETNLAFRNLGDLRFESVGPAWGLDQTGVSFGAALGDIDGDGDLDLVYSNYDAGATVLRNDSADGHRIVVALRGTRSNRFGVGATVRLTSAGGSQVRTLVLARGYLSTSEPVLHFGLGEDAVIFRLTVTWPSGHEQTFTDLPVDRRFEITEPAGPVPESNNAAAPATLFTDVSAAAGLHLSTAGGVVVDGRLQPLQPMRFSRRGPGLAAGDLDGDGQDDLLLGATGAEPTRAVRAIAPGRFVAENAPQLAVAAQVDAGPLLLFDADADGDNDALLTAAGTRLAAGAMEYQPRLVLNQGRGAWRDAAPGAFPSVPISVGAAVAADFDRDGRLDLFLGARVLPDRYPLPPRSALLANRSGKFEDVTEALAPGLREAGMVSAALWSDADGDGWIDLLLALEWGQVRCFRNRAGAGFEDWTEPGGFASAGAGWWQSLAAADFNGDSRPDYAAGNIGLNTPYQASAEKPALLYHGNFSTGGAPQLIEAYYEGEHVYPRRMRKDLGALIGAILRRYPTNDAYARATLGEILGENRLAAARRFAAAEFRSGVFLSQSDGRFRFTPLPRMAQIAPLQGIVAGDFDGDGHADLYAVQNLFAPIAFVGRFDGGVSQLLRGDGRGGFAPVPPAESGLVVPGDAKALVVTDLNADQWPDFVLTRNNTTTLAWQGNRVTDRSFLRVALRGPVGNTASIGARVTLELADGTTQTSDITAGSGYYSQSTPACFFGFPESNRPRRLRVRWPSGATSTHDVARDARSLVIAMP